MVVEMRNDDDTDDDKPKERANLRETNSKE
jgi:hypothetical protein